MTIENGPPRALAPGELWTKLQQMPRPSREVDFPRKGEDGSALGRVAMWVLTQEEQMMCASAAEKFAKERVKDGKHGDIGYETVYSNESVVQILLGATRDAADISKAFFPTAQAVRQTLTSEECARLFEYYLSVQLELGPIVAHLSKEELDAWIERIAEGGLAASPFVLLSPDTQKLLAHSMACLIVESRKARSSAGSPPDETPLDEEEEAPPEPAPDETLSNETPPDAPSTE